MICLPRTVILFQILYWYIVFDVLFFQASSERHRVLDFIGATWGVTFWSIPSQARPRRANLWLNYQFGRFENDWDALETDDLGRDTASRPPWHVADGDQMVQLQISAMFFSFPVLILRLDELHFFNVWGGKTAFPDSPLHTTKCFKSFHESWVIAQASGLFVPARVQFSTICLPVSSAANRLTSARTEHQLSPPIFVTEGFARQFLATRCL